MTEFEQYILDNHTDLNIEGMARLLKKRQKTIKLNL